MLLYSELFAEENIEILLANYVKAWQQGEEYCGETCEMLNAAKALQDSISPQFSLDTSSKKRVIRSKIDMQSLYYKNEASRTALFMIFRDYFFSNPSTTLLPLKADKQKDYWRVRTQWSYLKEGEISDGYIFFCFSPFEVWICQD